MLNPHYHYLAFDFETTGLDIKKDEPIQIGIVKFNHNFQVLDSFQSLIKPQKDIKELKEIVRRVTGFALEDLQSAPNAEEVFDKCKHFFIPKTVIVGHNIGFDLSFLQRYIDFIPHHQIDTFLLSKTFFHFQSSYALDVLNKQLQKKGEGWSGEGSAHNALYDSFSGMKLFKACITRITILRHKHILLDYVLQESKDIFKDIIRRSKKHYIFGKKKLFFPALKTYNKSNKKLVLRDSILFPENKENKRYIGNIAFKIFLQNIDRTKEKYILSFTHKSKMIIAQQRFEKLNIPYNTLHDNVIFDPDLVNNFLQKKSFNDAELLFVIKYFSQYEAGHNMIETNSLDDYKIFNAITKRKKQTHKEILFSTHQQLFQFSHKISKEHTVLFFDHERRYQNYSNVMKKAFDPLYLINLVDQLSYKYKIQGKSNKQKYCKNYLNILSIFIGVLSSELNQLFLGYKEKKQEIDYIIEHTRFPKTKNLFEKIKKKTLTLLNQIDNTDKTLVDNQRQKLSKYLSGLCTVEKKMYNGNQRYYLLYNRNLYLSYEDFLAQLPSASYKFLSNSNTHLSHTTGCQDSKTSEKTPFLIKTITNTEKLASSLTKKTTIQYVISSSKQNSQLLFQTLTKNKANKKYSIYAENITGGIGKNLYLASQSKKPIILIGGYNFFLESVAKKFDFSILYIYSIYGKMKQQIVHDILYYGG